MDNNEQIKYPRTYHTYWSEGVSDDDKVLHDYSNFIGKQVVVSIKYDGENCLEESILIQTEDGLKTIKEVCETKYLGKVLSYDIDKNVEEYNNIVNHLISSKSDDWYEIELETGETIKLTGNHYVWLPELMCYRQVKDLNGNENMLLIK